ncbi:MAG TPA: zf-HC2 domain-containing protein [Anaeromyxobacteraceae bacterium]|jgi:anti-sigma factor RsiW|nr:zf-HC2 domain-containing protein [Anaeromyxobacteraceae bacterium]
MVEIREAIGAMDCEELERSLDAFVDGEFEERERAEVEAHVALCERCRALVEEHTRFQLALRSRLRCCLGEGTPAGRAPAELRERILEAIAHERRPLWRSPALAAAALLLALVGGLALARQRVLPARTDALVEEAVRRHTRDLPLEVTAASAGADSVAGWFAGKLDFNPAPPRFHHPGVHLVGGRLSHLRDWPAAYIRYDAPRGRIGVFIVDDPEGRFAGAGDPGGAGPPHVWMAHTRGYRVAVWRQNDIVYSVVADLDERDLADLVTGARDDPR